jgi:hypothetical protein
MKRLAVLAFAAAILSGCASEPMSMKLPAPDGLPQDNMPRTLPPQTSVREMSVHELQAQLGLNRSADDLGFAHSNFDGCRMGVKDEGRNCGTRFFSVVHFRLVCRDTTGTTTRVPSSLTPLARNGIEWRLGGVKGHVNTDSQGYGQVQLVSSRPVKSERFMLIIGTKILGLEAGEVSQIVLPGNWCGSHVALNN